jgi:ABC-type uncharacterized transport system involved in gliding motility auxiliary subunit
MKNFSKVFLGLGLLLFFTSPITLFLSSGPLIAGIKAALGLLLIGAWFMTRDTSAGPTSGGMASGTRSAFYYSSSTAMAAAVVLLLAGINFIAAKRSKTYDMTAKKIYSLSPQTQQTLKDLKEPVTALGFLPAKHPAYDALEGLFRKYAAESEKFKYEFRDPRKSPDLAAKYQLKEGQTTVVLTKGEAHSSLDVLSEQELTNALIKLNTVGQQKVVWVLGHGEFPVDEEPPSADQEASLRNASEFRANLLQEGYTPVALNLSESNEIPRDTAVMIIAAARQKFTDREKKLVEEYLAQGGRLMYFAEALVESGLEDLLEKYGAKIEPGILADDRINPENPYVIISPFFADHEITRHLKSMRMNLELPTARGITVLRQGLLPGVQVVSVATTSPYAWAETTPNDRPHLDDGERAGAIPVVVAATRDTKGAEKKRYDEARVLVLGDAEVLVNALWGHEANRNLVLNGLAWTAAQSAKITIRPPDRDVSTVDITPETMATIRFASMDLLPIVLIATGLVIWLMRRNQ